MICTNCQGKKVFTDVSCLCVHLHGQPVGDCLRCCGAGVYDSPCPVCQGAGEIPDRFFVRFRRADNDETVEVCFDSEGPLPLELYEAPNSAYPEKTSRSWRLDLPALALPALARLGFASLDGFHVRRGDGGWLNSPHYMFDRPLVASNRSGHDPDPSAEDVQRQARAAFCRHCMYRFGVTSEIAPAEVELVEAQPASVLLERLQQACAERDCGFAIVVREGNIATCESGWQLFLTRKGSHVAELAVDYGLGEALTNALERVGTVEI